MSEILTSASQLKRQVSGVNSLNCTLSAVGKVSGSISTQVREAERYTGDYTVIPKADETQVLPTADKLLTDDITVNKVPFFETHNEYGMTAYIAMEVN